MKYETLKYDSVRTPRCANKGIRQQGMPSKQWRSHRKGPTAACDMFHQRHFQRVRLTFSKVLSGKMDVPRTRPRDPRDAGTVMQVLRETKGVPRKGV